MLFTFLQPEYVKALGRSGASKNDNAHVHSWLEFTQSLQSHQSIRLLEGELVIANHCRAFSLKANGGLTRAVF